MLRRAVAAALLTMLAAVISGCSTPDGQNDTGSTSPPAAGQPTGNESLGEAPVLADGRHPVLPTKVDVAGRKVTFDLIVFLTGQAAKDEWLKQNPQDPSGPPNDYMVINNNPLLRTLPVSANVVVKAVKDPTIDPVRSRSRTCRPTPTRQARGSSGSRSRRDRSRSWRSSTSPNRHGARLGENRGETPG